MKKSLLCLSACFMASMLFLMGCTHTITLVHTEGQAQDVVDETATNSTPVSPSLTIPQDLF